MNPGATLLYRYVVGIHPPSHFEDFYRRGVTLEDKGSSRRSFSDFLAHVASQNKILLAIIDVWTRLFDRQNPLRHRLNVVVAFAEINPEAIGRLERRDEAVFLKRLKITGWIFAYLFYLVASFPLIGFFYLIWRVGKK